VTGGGEDCLTPIKAVEKGSDGIHAYTTAAGVQQKMGPFIEPTVITPNALLRNLLTGYARQAGERCLSHPR